MGDVVAFDTGPANMVMDAVMTRLLGRAFDKGGAVAAGGRVLPGVVERAMRMPYLYRPAAEVVRAGTVWRGVCGQVFGAV